MKSQRKLLRALLLVVAGALLATQSGCGKDEKEQIAAAIGIQSVQDVRTSVATKIASGEYAKARQEGEAFLNGSSDRSGQLAWMLAKACAQSGGHDRALGYVIQALNAGAVSRAQIMDEPLLLPLHADTRLAAIAAASGDAVAAGASRR
ncbi:hypothetical protein [Massilia cavernae]|uniref:Sel1 repeat family protein n=1 Tax=Massilia cavernae TaxID=2320864 RepID=A0A418Y575_9BURK|nr:hypothetical protein [Massilia cavernae]RJG21294.1 hypothetical protein D3872_07090 [Massilia cavernae]